MARKSDSRRWGVIRSQATARLLHGEWRKMLRMRTREVQVQARVARMRGGDRLCREPHGDSAEC